MERQRRPLGRLPRVTVFSNHCPFFSKRESLTLIVFLAVVAGSTLLIRPPPVKPALDAYMARGKKVFEAKCIVCHGPDAKGNGVTFPSLVGSAWANGETERFAMIVLNGLQGPASNGKTYGVMTPQGIGMTAEELAGIMTYVRNHFGNTKGDVITTEMAKAAINISAARKNSGQAVTAAELTADHVNALPGKPVAATTLVDPLTLEPVPSAAAPPVTAPPAAGAPAAATPAAKVP
jgi:mono/diheme cytochrome c family protein